MATHHLLNIINPKEEPSAGWISQTNIWRESVLAILKKHNCTQQEIAHFEVINQFEVCSICRS